MAKGWLDNYNDSKVSAPEGFEGEGYSMKGRNYSPAWGGQFQLGGSVYPVNYVPEAAMGASIPGAVGFSYARTQSPAPSNGKYAKKTMASAQNGKEMQYYQNGLDFKPKSISKNGSWLSKYDVAQDGYTTGDKVTYGTPEYREAYDRGEVVTKEGEHSPIALPEVVIQNNYKRPRGFWEQYKDKIIEENKDAGVLGAIIGTPLSAITSLPQLAATYALTGKAERPSEAIGFENKEGLFESPSSFGKHASNFVLDAVTDPTNLIGAGELTALGRLTKEQALAKLAKIETSVAPELRQGLKTNGLTFNGTPRKYPINNSQRAVNEDIERLFKEFPELEKIGNKEDYIKHLENIYPESTQPGIFYRGSKNPNLNASEWVSNPSGGNNLGQGFYFTPDPFKAEKYGKEAKALLNIKNPTYTSLRLNSNGLVVPDSMMTKDLVEEGSGIMSVQNPNRDLFTEMGSRDEGYMHKYKGPLDEQGFPVATKPYSSSPDYVEYSQIDEIAVPNNSQIHVLGSDTDKELFKNYLNNNKKRDGGIIKDDRGQWDHPGEITEIGSNEITMEGVPYDVLGISDTGDTKLMKPGKDYKFKGKKVTEYPMAKDGLRQEQKSLQNLDNLTNFTNYNKPQPGGWLNKYN